MPTCTTPAASTIINSQKIAVCGGSAAACFRISSNDRPSVQANVTRSESDATELPISSFQNFSIGDTPTTKLDHGLLIADYPIKDWNTGKPKPLVAKAGEQYIVTGTFAINSIGGFAASDGLIIHKKFADATGKVIAEGNAVLPPDAQDIKLEGKPAEMVGGKRIDAEKGGPKKP